MSRVLGVIRDMLIARFVGTGIVADAFLTAFRFPNMFRRIFGEGAYNSAFVPLFGKRVATDGRNAAMVFSNQAFSVLALVLGVLTLAAIPLMGFIMLAVVPGFLPKVEAVLEPEPLEFRMEVKGAKAIWFEGRADLSDLKLIERGEPEIGKTVAEIFGGEGQASGKEVPVSLVLAEAIRERQEVPEGSSVEEEVAKIFQATEKGERWRYSEGELLKIPLPELHDYAVVTGKASSSETEQEFRVYRNDPAAFDLTVRLSQITFVYLLCMALVAHLSGVLTTLKKFAAPAFAPVLLNVVFILGLVGVMRFSNDPGGVLAWCVAVGGFVQLGVLWWVCQRAGLPVRLTWPSLSPEIKRLILLMGPGVIAAGIQQINLTVGGIIASFQQGAISFLYYSDRVYQLPLGMIGIAFGMVLLPEISRLVKLEQAKEASDTMVRALEMAMIVTVPAAVALMVIPREIISVLFERGDFTDEDSVQCGRALAAFAVGLPGYVLIKVLQPGFFAREDTKSPMQMAGITVVVNIVVSLCLFPFLGHVGIAIATSVAAWVNVWLLWNGLRGMFRLERENWVRLGAMLAASLLMAGLLLLVKSLMGDWNAGTAWQRIVALGLMIGTGMTAYGFGALCLRATSLEELKAGFRRS